MNYLRLKKATAVLILISVMLSFCFIGLMFFNFNKSVKADLTPTIFVQKVVLPDIDKNNMDYSPKEVRHILSSAVNIENNQFVMLNTEANNYTTDSGENVTAREAVYISFTGVTLINNVNLKYNGKVIKSTHYDEIDSDGMQIYTQYLHALTPTEVENANLPDDYITSYSTGNLENVELPEGRYDIEILYYDKTANKDSIPWKYTFYITTQATYSTLYEKVTFNDTEKFTLSNQDYSTMHYFGYNNEFTTIYDEGGALTLRSLENKDKLYYPTMYYNPEKYNISYTRTLYNYTEKVNLSFTAKEYGSVEYGELTVNVTTNTGLANTRIYKINKSPKNFILKIQFDRAGEYIINKTARLRTGMQNSVAEYAYATKDVISSNETLLQSEQLIINGFSAQYADSLTTTAPLYNDNYCYAAMDNPTTMPDTIFANEFLRQQNNDLEIAIKKPTAPETIYTADYSFLNEEKINLADADVKTSDFINANSTIKNNIFNENKSIFNLKSELVKMPSTNLAPVSFEFYGKLLATNKSWYAYKDNLGEITVKNYARNQQFESAGTYLVYLTYKNMIFQDGQIKENGKSTEYHHQIFYFEITNTTPQIEVYATEKSNLNSLGVQDLNSKILNVDDYTKQFVYCSWETPGPFDAQIYAKYYIYDWNNSKAPIRQGNLKGLVYQKNKLGDTVILDNSPTILYGANETLNGISGLDGNYHIQIFSSKSPDAYINHSFQIDTSPITGISALQVNGKSLVPNAQNNATVLSELTKSPLDFNLATNKSFAWTWDDKVSGAKIYAKYIYASLQEISDFTLDESYISQMETMAQNGKVLMKTNGKFEGFTPAVDYHKVDKTAFNTQLASSQIISSPQLAILLLADEAGNTEIFTTILDNTKTQILQNPEQSAFVNIITTDTNFYWGTHKSLSIVDEPTISEKIVDIYDFINANFAWKLSGQTYVADKIIQDEFKKMDIIENQSVIIPLEKVEINTSDRNTEIIEPGLNANNKTKNWYAVIKVNAPSIDNPNAPYTTQVCPDNKIDLQNHPIHKVENGQFYYTIAIKDVIGNFNEKFNVEVNLDRSQGALYSYNNFEAGNDSYTKSLESKRILNNTTDRQHVTNSFSTNRRYVTFSWTEPQEYFKIASITLKYYPFSYNITNKNYPYTDEAIETTLYSLTDNYDELYTFTASNGGIYNQTQILLPINYVPQFNNGRASSEGMYVITRTYHDKFQEGSTEAGGDVKVKTYTYYIDRKPIIPASTNDYGEDIKLQFGYEKGQYQDYPNYGDFYFNQFSRTTITDTFFNSVKFNNIVYPTLPTNIVIDSNILPAGIKMSTWKEKTILDNDANIPDMQSASVYDKYYIAPEPSLSEGDATKYLNDIFNKFRNSSRLQVGVQFFRNQKGTNYDFESQNFYSNVFKTETGTDYSHPLDDLKNAFNKIGKYRIILFDLSNFQGILTGNSTLDFENLTYHESLTPNCTIFNFELKGIPPTFNYQSGENSYTSIDTNSVTKITNDKNVRITWADPIDKYSAQIAFNNVTVYKNIYTKHNPKFDENGKPGISASQSSHTYKNPILLTYDRAEYEELKNNPNEIENETFIYKDSLKDFDGILNAPMDTYKLNETKFYKIKIENVYNYFIIMPKMEFENQRLYGDKLVDVEYTTTVNYIYKDKADYEINGDSKNYITTDTVFVDNTAPYQNLVNLIKNDKYINSLNTDTNNFAEYLIENIDNPNLDFLKSYAFAVNRNFVLDFKNIYDTGLNYYFFKRTNYNGDPLQQTVVQEKNGEVGALNKFSPTDPNYKLARYKINDNTSGLNYINELGYYDIIEQDKAGNKRVYTIYVTDSVNEIDASINKEHFKIETNKTGTVVYQNNEVFFDKDTKKVFSNENFRLDNIQNEDRWLRITLKDNISQEKEIYYLSPDNAFAQISTLKINTLPNLITLRNKVNEFIEKTYLKHLNEYGSQVLFSIDDKIDSKNNINLYINTPGQNLVPDETAFLQLITENPDGTFTIKLPDTKNIISTKLVDFKVYLNGTIQSTDSELKPLPTLGSNFESPEIANGFKFNLAIGNNMVYKFEFTDNFGRTTKFSYPLNAGLKKELQFTGNTTTQMVNGKSTIYCSSETKFVYQSSALRFKLKITDLDTNSLLYTNDVNGRLVDLDPKSPYFSYELDELTASVTTITFKAPIGIHYLFEISVDNYTDTATNYSFVIYTHLPQVTLSDISGSPLLNTVTSKSVMINWEEIEALFSPYVTITYPDNTEKKITRQTVVKDEGIYTINVYNSLGKYIQATKTFTIRAYPVAIYGVNQINSDNTTTMLTPHEIPYHCNINDESHSMPHYFFLSSDSNWDRTIEIICNEDKGLSYKIVAKNGNTRVYNVFGTTTHILSTYFAITRIPSINIATNTNFRINGEIMVNELKNIYTKQTDSETAKAVLTWQTTFKDETVLESEYYDYIYKDFYYVELWYNGVKVGAFTSGSITLTDSGIYSIRVYDTVGQNQYFGAGYSEFTLSIINDVVYYVNNLAPIQFATFSKPVEIFIPLQFSGDLNKYDSMEVTATRNNEEYEYEEKDGKYIFTTPGVYNVNMKGSIKSIVGTNSADLLANYQFTILSSDEAIESYEFNSMAGYEIIQVIRSGADITNEIKQEKTKIHNLYIDSENYGVGKYEITVLYEGIGYKPTQTYSFNFWINNEAPIINSSRDWGSSSTQGFTLTINPASIYERVGNCNLLVNGNIVLTINQENGNIIEPSTFNYEEKGVYLIQMQSESGNILTSNRITINERLNTAAIVLIVVVCVVIVALIITFILMRNRMKIK